MMTDAIASVDILAACYALVLFNCLKTIIISYRTKGYLCVWTMNKYRNKPVRTQIKFLILNKTWRALFFVSGIARANAMTWISFRILLTVADYWLHIYEQFIDYFTLHPFFARIRSYSYIDKRFSSDFSFHLFPFIHLSLIYMYLEYEEMNWFLSLITHKSFCLSFGVEANELFCSPRFCGSQVSSARLRMKNWMIIMMNEIIPRC